MLSEKVCMWRGRNMWAVLWGRSKIYKEPLKEEKEDQLKTAAFPFIWDIEMI